MPKITKRLVEAAEVREKDYIIFDGEIPGFGIRVLPSGKRSYLVQYRAGRKFRRMSLGLHGILTAEKARAKAINVLAQVGEGQDPAGDRAFARGDLTVDDLGRRVIEEHALLHCKPRTVDGYRYYLKAYIHDRIGHLRVGEISRADIAGFHHDLRFAPVQANRCLQFLSKAFSLAEVWGLRPDGSNPCRHVARYPEKKRERFLDAAELRRVGKVLREMETEAIELPSAILAVRLLMLTGCRLNEIMTLRWEYVDLSDKVLRLPDSKTGAKVVHLGQPAIEYLQAAERIGNNPWVIPGTLQSNHLSDLQPFWQRVRARAGLKDVRIHDLRHTFASIALAAGQGLPMIGKLLGHTQVQTTARYAHIASDPIKQAAASVANEISVCL
jgi:integrase